MTDHVDSVKEVSAFLRAASTKNKNPEMQCVLVSHADTLDSVVDEMVRLYGLTTALPPDLGNIHDLPQELLSELSVSKADDLEDKLVTVINSYGGVASLDQILVGLYRKFEISQKRRFLQNKLYRMEMVWSVEGKKGVYSTKEPEPDAEVEPDIQPHDASPPTEDSKFPF